MAIVVVGGHTKNIGKTSVVAGLIRAMPEMRWTAFKISQDGEGLGLRSQVSGFGFQVLDEPSGGVRWLEERDGASGSDSARFLAAGAVRSFWVRTQQGALAEAMPRIREEMARAENVLIESNSVLEFLRPDLYLSVLDPGVADFKDSARYFLDRADAVLVPEGVLVSLKLVAPVLAMRPPVYVTEEVVEFVRRRLGEHTPGAEE